MWPWGHVAFGYLLHSLARHLGWRRAPGGDEVAVLAVAALLPDLVDKPLSWTFGLFPQGYSVAHSVFVAVPLALLVVLLAVRTDRGAVGGAFLVGYWSHLAGDVLVATVLRKQDALARVLWPLVTLPAYDTDRGALDRALYYAANAVEFLGTTDSLAVLFVYLGPLAAAVLLWVADGAPGVAETRRLLAR